MTIELYSWGGAEEVTGSKHFLKADDSTIMVDCGAFQGRREEADRKNREWPFDHAALDAVIMTHAHYDHCGLLPLLIAKGYQKTIYATPATRDLANLILRDSANIQDRDIAFLQKKALQQNETFTKEPLYTENDVRKCMEHLISIPYHKPFFPAPGLQVRYYDAGHILGSAIAVVDVNNNGSGMRIGFTGDLGRKNLPIIRDPEYIPPVDYLVLESTYGNRLHKPVDTTMDLLADIIVRTARRGGKIIIPAFAIERTQELIFFIHLLSDQLRIPKIPIYVDSPMAVHATTVFMLHNDCFDDETQKAFLDHEENPFGFNELKNVVSKGESQKINDLRQPAIIISSSGMCESGRILHHLAHNIADPRNTILFVGYLAEHTLGRKILEKECTVRIFNDTYPVRAEVAVLNSFSGHADYNEMLEYVSNLDKKRLKKIFLVHGEKEAQTHLQKVLAEQKYTVEIVKAGERYLLE
jgi:metallo-beta-lactamase family protein